MHQGHTPLGVIHFWVQQQKREMLHVAIIGSLCPQVCTVMTGSPANDAGLQVGDFLVSVQGMDVFECDHAQVVTAVKGAGNSLNLAVERYRTAQKCGA